MSHQLLMQKKEKRKNPSKRYFKTQDQYKKLWRNLTNIRKDSINNIVHRVAKKYTTNINEGLKIKNMTKSAKGTVENPGKNVKAKSGLNRVLLSTGSEFFTQD